MVSVNGRRILGTAPRLGVPPPSRTRESGVARGGHIGRGGAWRAAHAAVHGAPPSPAAASESLAGSPLGAGALPSTAAPAALTSLPRGAARSITPGSEGAPRAPASPSDDEDSCSGGGGSSAGGSLAPPPLSRFQLAIIHGIRDYPNGDDDVAIVHLAARHAAASATPSCRLSSAVCAVLPDGERRIYEADVVQLFTPGAALGKRHLELFARLICGEGVSIRAAAPRVWITATDFHPCVVAGGGIHAGIEASLPPLASLDLLLLPLVLDGGYAALLSVNMTAGTLTFWDPAGAGALSAPALIASTLAWLAARTNGRVFSLRAPPDAYPAAAAALAGDSVAYIIAIILVIAVAGLAPTLALVPAGGPGLDLWRRRLAAFSMRGCLPSFCRRHDEPPRPPLNVSAMRAASLARAAARAAAELANDTPSDTRTRAAAAEAGAAAARRIITASNPAAPLSLGGTAAASRALAAASCAPAASPLQAAQAGVGASKRAEAAAAEARAAALYACELEEAAAADAAADKRRVAAAALAMSPPSLSEVASASMPPSRTSSVSTSRTGIANAARSWPYWLPTHANGQPLVGESLNFVAPRSSRFTNDGRVLLLAPLDELADTHCFYHAYARWRWGDASRHLEARALFCGYMETHWLEFADFTGAPYTGEERHGPVHRAVFMAFMRAHRGLEFADELQHLAFRAMHPGSVLHVWRTVGGAATPAALAALLAGPTLAEAHEAEARARDPARVPVQLPPVLPNDFSVIHDAYGNHYMTVVAVGVDLASL